MDANQLGQSFVDQALESWRSLRFLENQDNTDFIRRCMRDLRSLLGKIPRDKDSRSLAAFVQKAMATLYKFRDLPAAQDGAGDCGPLIFLLAKYYLAQANQEFNRYDCIGYFRAFQSSIFPLSYLEIVSLVAALQLSILLSLNQTSLTDAIANAHPLRALLDDLDRLSGGDYVSRLYSAEPFLEQDPAGIYTALDPHSKTTYREALERLARSLHTTPESVCRIAVQLAARHPINVDVRFRLLSHVGYYLMDDGLSALRHELNDSPPFVFSGSKKTSIAWCLGVYIFLVGLLLSAVTHICHISLANPLGLATAGSFAILVSQCVLELIGVGIYDFAVPSILPRLALTAGIPREYSTIVAIPSLLFNEDHVRSLVNLMEEHYALNPERNVCFALMTDFSDNSAPQPEPSQRALLDLCCSLVEGLNNQPECREQPFFLLHRDPAFSQTQRAWIGWERKRGKLMDLARYVLHGISVFSRSVGEIERLREAQYVVVLDDNTRLRANAVRQLIGTHAHPLNHAHVDEEKKIMKRGYGILQPGIARADRPVNPPNEISGLVDSVRRDIYQDILGQCPFVGQGSINIGTYARLLDGLIPDECVLSHDSVEGGFVATGAAIDVTLLETVPSSYTTLSMRQHRWIRGDWQNVTWLLKTVNSRPRRMPLFGRVHIAMSLVNTLLPVATTFLLLRAASSKLAVMITVIVLLLGPRWVFFALRLRHAAGRRDRNQFFTAWRGFARSWRIFVESAFVSAHQAMIALDGIVRTAYRLATRRRLMEWRTSSGSEREKTITLSLLYEWIVALAAMTFLIWSLTKGGPPLLLTCLLLMWGLGFPVWRIFSTLAK